MPDNVTLNQPESSGAIIATDDIAGVQHQLIKLEFGEDGNATMVSATNPLPITVDNQITQPLTDAQLRATPVPITGTISVDTTGLATSVKQDAQTALLTTIDADTSNLDVALSTRLKPSDTLAGVTSVGSIVGALPSGDNNIGNVDIVTMPSISGTVTANAGTNLNTSALALETTQLAGNVLAGAVNETAPANDTASSGLNGRLQRIAQRLTSLITALGNPFQAGGSIGNTAFGVNNGAGASAVNIQDGGNTITVDGTITANAGTNLNTSLLALETTQSAIRTAVEIIDNAISGTEMQVDVVAPLPAGNNNIGDVDVASLPTIPAGTNYIGKTRLTDGTTDAEVIPLTNYNAQAVAIVDGTGNQITSFGGGTQYTEDTAAAADPIGTAVNLIRQDTPATVTNANGDNIAQRGTNYGAAYVQIVTSTGAFVNSFGSPATPLFKGSTATFRTLGRAGTTGQKIAAIHNATGSAIKVKVRKIRVDWFCTVVKAVTVAPPIVRIWKFTAVPTNGTVLTKNKIGGTTTSNASCVVWGDASADGTGSGTTLTVTLPAGTILDQQAAPRIITAVGEVDAFSMEFDYPEFIELSALEGVCVFLDYTVATQNPVTDMWMTSIQWEEE
jgi:hypothetical protein